MSEQRGTAARPRVGAASGKTAAQAAVRRRRQLFAALDLSWRQPFPTVLQVARAGGALEVGVHNSGLAPAFQAYVDVVRVVYRLRPPTGRGLFVWQEREGAPSFWRRGRRGEVLAPDTRLATPTGRTFSGEDTIFPEALVSGDPQDRRSTVIARSWVGALAPRAATTVQVMVTPSEDLDPEPEGVWSWCLVARGFDLLQEPPAPVVLPTPQQPPHHTRLMCLHDTLT